MRGVPIECLQVFGVGLKVGCCFYVQSGEGIIDY